jgi:hypothetical protein
MRSMARHLGSITRAVRGWKTASNSGAVEGLIEIGNVLAPVPVSGARKRAGCVRGNEAGTGLVSGAVSRSGGDAFRRRRPGSFSAS